MHIPDGLLSAPVAAASGVIGACGLGYGLRAMERKDAGRSAVLTGVMAAFLFAAQMVNFPVGLGVSGHLMGGVLAAVLLGPWSGSVAIAAVLIVQCLAFGDGGLTALGANFVNMGLLGSVVGYAIYDPIRRSIGGRRGVLLGAMAGAWFSVFLAAGALAVELAASGRLDRFGPILGWLALVHAAIGVGEAVITGMVLRFVLLTRPDLIDAPIAGSGPSAVRPGKSALAGLAIAVSVAVFLGPWAFDRPDGLEYVGSKFGLIREGDRPAIRGLFPDYEVAIPGFDRPGFLTASAGLVGTLIVFGVAAGLSRGLAAGRGASAQPEARPDAA